MYMFVIHIEKRWLVKTKKRLAVDLPVVLHNLIAQVSAERNFTITDWLKSAVLEKLIREGDIEVVEESPLLDEHFFRG